MRARTILTILCTLLAGLLLVSLGATGAVPALTDAAASARVTALDAVAIAATGIMILVLQSLPK